jgi:glycerol-3-phosphate dehydrogenase (NAD(P)+)
MVIGAADELALGDNMRGYLMVAAMHEMDAIVMQLGGSATTSHHLAGLGDLVTTATSASSHHHELGGMLVRGELDAIRGEGIHTLAMVRKHALINFDDYPLFKLARHMVDAPVDIEGKFREYLKQKFPPA